VRVMGSNPVGLGEAFVRPWPATRNGGGGRAVPLRAGVAGPPRSAQPMTFFCPEVHLLSSSSIAFSMVMTRPSLLLMTNVRTQLRT
jgi:hypothetical protein